MQQLKRRSHLLAFQLRYGIAGLVAISVVLIATFLVSLATYVNIQNTLNLQDSRSQVVASQVTAYVEDLERKFSYLSRIEGMTDWPQDVQLSLIEGLIRQNAAYESITLLNAQAETKAEIIPYGVELPITERDEAFELAYRQKENFVGTAQLSEVGETLPLLTLAVPLYDTTNTVSGAAIARINLKFLWTLISNTRVGEMGYAYLLDNRDIVTAQLRDENGYVLESIAERAFISQLRDRAGYSLNQATSRVATFYQGLYHRWVIGSATPIETVNWLAVVEIPLAEALIPLRNLLIVTLLGLMLILPIILFMSFRWTHRIILPLNRLHNAATHLSQGDLSVRVSLPPRKRRKQNELHDLSRTFNHMADQLQQKVSDLTEEKCISEQALVQVRQAQVQLVQAEKMSSLGQMVAGIAHEINNPVNFIHGNTECLDEYVKDIVEFLNLYQSHYPNPPIEVQQKSDELDIEFLQEDIVKILSSMRMGTERIREIVKSLRIFSRLDESEIKHVDIHDGLDSTLLILNSRLESDSSQPAIEVEKQYGDLPEIVCFAGQLNQVFMNILSNAIDALRDCNHSEPKIEVVTSVEKEQIRIDIKDNGPGIPEKIQSKIFDPFFTTKAVGKGTGMGMSISYKIVTETHGGTLSLISAPDQGAHFIVCIPFTPLRTH